MKCKCGKEITKEEDKLNIKIAKESNTLKVNMCESCFKEIKDQGGK